MKHGSDVFGLSARYYLDPQLRRALADGKLARSRHGSGRHPRDLPDDVRRAGREPGAAPEPPPAAPLDATAAAADSQFLRKAVMLNMAALEAGHCAQAQCADAGLRGLAGQMVRLLGRIDAECRALAERHAVSVAEQLDGEHRDQMSQLQDLDGAAFEHTYLRKYAMEAQLELIRLCGTELTHGADESLRAAAGRWLQELRSALVLSRQMYFAPQPR